MAGVACGWLCELSRLVRFLFKELAFYMQFRTGSAGKTDRGKNFKSRILL